MERKLGIFSVDGRSIEYTIAGSGEPVLVMHGGHSNCREEFGYRALLESGFSVITPSRAGYGGTSKEVGTSLASACAHYAELLHHLKIKKVHVLAISAGGPSGIYFAAKYPELVQTLTLQSAVTKTWLTQEDKEYKVAKRLFHPGSERFTWHMLSTMNTLFPRFIFKQMFASFSKLPYQEAKHLLSEQDVEEVRKMNSRQRSGAGFFLDLEHVNELTTEELKAVQCPTFIMHSRHDGSVPLDHPNYALQHIPFAQLCLLESWGHLIWLGHSSKETDQQTIQFLHSFEISEALLN